MFGVEALVAKQQGKLLTLEVKQSNVVCGIIVPVPAKRVECEIEDVVEMQEVESMDPKTMKSLGSLTNAERRFMLKAACGNEICYVLNGEPGTMLHDADLHIIYEYLQWQYMMPEVMFLKPAMVKIATHFGTTAEVGMMCMLEIKDAMKSSEILVLPVHCDEPLHWTFIALRLEPESDKILEVKYYDWCNGVKQSAALAQRMLSLLTIDEANPAVQPMKLPKPCNWYRQRPASNDCGFALWQALENAMKKKRLEGDVGVLPQPVQWRKTLKTLLVSLQTQQDRWRMEEATGSKVKIPVSLPGVKAMGPHSAPLKVYPKQFYTCSSCRWSASGEGCCYCNPEKHKALNEVKQKRSREMAAALEKALQNCKDLGLIPQVPAPAEDAILKGGAPEGIFVNVKMQEPDFVVCCAEKSK